MKKRLLIILLLLLLTGCKKETITSDKFISTFKEYGFIVKNNISEYEKYDYMQETYIAASKDLSYQIEFFVFVDSEYAQKFYIINKDELALNSFQAMVNEKNGSNYHRYEIMNDSNYALISQIDNTIIYVNTSEYYQEELQDFIQDIGY